MTTLEVGNLWYYTYICIAIVCITAGYVAMKDKSAKKKFDFVMLLACVNFAIHFLKILLPEYQSDYPMSWRKNSFENI